MKVVKYSVYLVQISLFLGLVIVDSVTAQASRGVEGVEKVKEVGLFPSNTDSNLLAQQNSITRVTEVELKQTNKGLEVILKTAAGGQRLVPLILPEGKNLVLDILDATLGFDLIEPI